MKYYNNYLNNISKTPYKSHMELMQESINATWDNTTQSESVMQQKNIGSDIYIPIDISVDMAIDLGTGIKKSDDFKTFSYKDISQRTLLGLMYVWEENYWITTDTSDLGSPIKSVNVRRCNNIAKWVDVETGTIKQQRCVIDYEVSSPSPKVDKDVQVQNGHIVMIIQGNKDTLKLKRNQRFLFNGEPYKLTGYNNMLQNNIVDENTTLLYFDLYLDIELPTDDMLNNIANRHEYNYEVFILENPTEQIQGFSGTLNAIVKLNGNVIQKDVVWSAVNSIINSNGNYTLTGDVDSIAIFTATFGSFKSSVEIYITSNVIDSYEMVVNPNITEINQGNTVTIEANLYKNGLKQNDIVTATLSGANTNTYSWRNEIENVFTLTNHMRSIVPLYVTFSSGVHSKSIAIQLKAMF